jgi:hypothetical protein
VAGLGACPLCRSTLDEPAQAVTACPSCGADLRPYIALQERTEHYLRLAQELTGRGEAAVALGILEQLPHLGETDPRRVSELRFRIALAQGELEQAGEILDGMDGAPLELQAELQTRLHLRHTAQELYNYALGAARQERFEAAADALERAVRHDPGEAALWQLKLKVDLKCERFERCYRDLEALDRMNARPAQYQRLEALLPPVGG